MSTEQNRRLADRAHDSASLSDINQELCRHASNPSQMLILLEANWEIDDHFERKVNSLTELMGLLARYQVALHRIILYGLN
jgi:hypothetical protein